MEATTSTSLNGSHPVDLMAQVRRIGEIREAKMRAISATPSPARKSPDELAAEYRNLLRIGVPAPRVLAKMGIDGFDIKTFDKVFDLDLVERYYTPAYESSLKPTVEMAAKAEAPRRKKLHITTIPKSMTTLRLPSEENEEISLWRIPLDAKVSQGFKAAIEARYVIHARPLSTSQLISKSTHRKTGPTNLIERGRAQNLSILLVGFKLSSEDWRECILTMRFNEKYKHSLEMLLSLWPLEDEERTIRAFDCNDGVDKLSRADIFFLSLRDIPRLKQKIKCLLFRVTFSTRIYEAEQSIAAVTRTLEQVMSKTNFVRAMKYTFRVCLLINHGDSVESAMATTKGLRISALAQLLCFKSAHGGETVLQTIAEGLQRDHPEVAKFCDELTLLSTLSTISVPDLRGTQTRLQEDYEILMKELGEALRDKSTTNAEGKMYTAVLTNFAGEADLQLRELRKQTGQMDHVIDRFYRYCEEPLDTPFSELVQVLVRFVQAYSHERLAILRRSNLPPSNPNYQCKTTPPTSYLTFAKDVSESKI